MKNKLALIISLALVLSFALSSCNNIPNEVDKNMQNNEATTSDVQKAIPKASSELGFADNLLRLTAADGNRTVSPYSAKMCLALLANGTDGETRAQILNAIGIEDIDAYNGSVKEILNRYDSYSAVLALNTANSLWMNQTQFGGRGAFLPEYRTKMQNFFDAEIREVTNSNSVEEVNKWVNEKTKEKIDQILTNDNRDFAIALVNAVYFKGAWDIPFSEHATKERDFNNIDGTASKLDFMHITDSYGYYADENVKAVQIDYARRGGDFENEVYIRDNDFSFSMYIMLAENELNVEKFLNENAPFSSTRVKLAIPKFEMEYGTSLNEILMALGMTAAFDVQKADFTKMVEEASADNLFVDSVIQKTYIKLDENGTEAAAVTAIAVECMSAPIDVQEPVEFTADKPFYFAIRDNTSGELLFLGRYESAK